MTTLITSNRYKVNLKSLTLSFILVIAIAATLGGCNSGTTSSSGTAPIKIQAEALIAPKGSSVAGSISSIYYSGGYGNPYTLYIPMTSGNFLTVPGPQNMLGGSTGAYITPSGNLIVLNISGIEYLADTISSSYIPFNFSAYTTSHPAYSSQPFVILNDDRGVTNLIGGVYAADGGIVHATATESATVLNPHYSDCSTTATATTALTAITLPDGNYVGVGTDEGDICFFGVSGTNSGKVKNLTNNLNNYFLGSPVLGIAFTATVNLGYVYWYNQNGSIWRATYTANHDLQSLAQVNGSPFIAAPTMSANNTSAIYTDSQGNLYIGTTHGKIYVLAPNSNIWSSIQLQNGSGIIDSGSVQAIASGINGGIFATTITGNSYILSL